MAKFKYHVNRSFVIDDETYVAGTVVALDEVAANQIRKRVFDPLRFVGRAVEVEPVEVIEAAEDEALTLDDGPLQDVTVTAPLTLTLPDVEDGASFTLRLRQDGTGGHAVTLAGSVRWPGGAAPTLTTDANAIDVLVFIADAADGVWDGFLSGAGMAVPA